MAEQVAAVSTVLTALEARDWTRFGRLLADDVHWTTAADEDLHGRDAVVARLSKDPPPAPPSYHELRDGLVVRWIDCPG